MFPKMIDYKTLGHPHSWRKIDYRNMSTHICENLPFLSVFHFQGWLFQLSFTTFLGRLLTHHCVNVTWVTRVPRASEALSSCPSVHRGEFNTQRWLVGWYHVMSRGINEPISFVLWFQDGSLRDNSKVPKGRVSQLQRCCVSDRDFQVSVCVSYVFPVSSYSKSCWKRYVLLLCEKWFSN